MSKARLSVSVDADLVEAGETSVARGRAKTLSAWVNDALRLKADHDRRLDSLGSFIAAYEQEHGEITAEEMRLAARRARARAVPARAMPSPRPPRATKASRR
ncbi:MAG: hypothetical protein M3Y87_22670 [Myxococcota bacterium]|nr:hypothetical protein [Myxococcota bacterium]